MSMYKLQPTVPTSQRWIQQEFDQLNFDLHKERLRNVRPSINCAPPKIYSHMEIKLKRLQLESDRLMHIETENRRLLKALVDTAQRPTSIRTRNDYTPKSLNINKRLNSTVSVLRDNEKLVNRLINAKPTHNWAKLDKDWEDREKLMHNISRYRHPWRKPNEGPRRQPPDDDEELNFARLSSVNSVRSAQSGKSPVLLKKVAGRKGINHRRASSMETVRRRSLERGQSSTFSERDEEAGKTEKKPMSEEHEAEVDG